MSRSIASMTGGSRVAQGATLITTCRTDKDTARKISQMNVKDSDLNVAKYEMCLAPSSKRAKTEAYCNVMSKDPSCPVGNATCTSALPTDSHYQVLAALGVSKLDNSMSTYYRDYYDARSELELFMVTHQISIHVHPNVKSDATYKKFDELQYFNGMLNAGSGIAGGATAAPNICRKHPILFALDAEYKKFEGEATAEKTFKDVTKDFAFVWGGRTLIVNIAKLKKDEFEEQLIQMINTVYEKQDSNDLYVRTPGESVPSVNTPKNPVGDSVSIEPPTWTFQGFSLGAAHMDQRDGDNCFSVLRSGAFTCRNGPFHINSGDDLMWVQYKELVCFSKDGYRHLRPVATLEMMKKCAYEDNANKRVKALYTSLQSKVASAENQAMQQRGKIDPTGDHTTILRTYIIAPIRASFKSLVKNSSIMDSSRRVTCLFFDTRETWKQTDHVFLSRLGQQSPMRGAEPRLMSWLAAIFETRKLDCFIYLFSMPTTRHHLNSLPFVYHKIKSILVEPVLV